MSMLSEKTITILGDLKAHIEKLEAENARLRKVNDNR